MRGNTGWNYKPYTRLIDMDVREKPFICGVAPFETGFEIQWFDHGQPEGGHALYYRGYASLKEWNIFPLEGDTARIENLIEEHDYEFKVVRTNGTGESGVRLARTGFVPGTVVNYLHPEDKTYAFSGHSLCSPTIVKLPSGDLMTAMDVFTGQFGNSKFVHKEKLYLFSGTQDYGDMVIGRSDDEGETWTNPTHIISGCGPNEMGPHKGPMPVIEFNHRLYTAIDYGCWRRQQHSNGLLSIDVDDDLLDAANWRFTPFTRYDPNWENAPKGFCPGCIEGNAVVSPDGVISNYLRIDHPNCVPKYGRAVVLRGKNDDPEAKLELDRIVDCPLGSNSKFQLYQDPVTKKYIMIGTEQAEDKPNRTVLSMAVSEDFYTWKVVKRILDYRHADPAHVGFQYPDWMFDGDDILLLVRTAFGRSFNFHDANYQCFIRIENFRQYL